MQEETKTKCEVCGENPHKYRCPSCRIVYCSVVCFKRHRAEDLCQPIKEGKPAEESKVSLGETSEQTRAEEVDKEDGEVSSNDEGGETAEEEIATRTEINTDQLKPEQLQKLDESEKLKSLLQNPHLRDLITNVDQARDKGAAIEAAMQEPLFVEFADACLTMTGGDDDEVADAER